MTASACINIGAAELVNHSMEKWKGAHVRKNRSIRRILGLLAAVLLGFSGATVVSAPAYAARSVYFEGYDIWGFIHFQSAARYSIATTVSNPYSAGTVSVWSQGQFFTGDERRICGGTRERTNYIFNTTTNFYDTTSCRDFNIQQVMIVEEHTNEIFDIIYVDNPLA